MSYSLKPIIKIAIDKIRDRNPIHRCSYYFWWDMNFIFSLVFVYVFFFQSKTHRVTNKIPLVIARAP